MKKPIRIALVDDHVVVRRGVANLLNKEAGIKVAFDVSNGQELHANLEWEANTTCFTSTSPRFESDYAEYV